MRLEAGDTDADQAQRTGPVGQCAVEARTGELPDPLGVVRADRQ